MAQESVHDFDLVELSDLAWGFLDADDAHEAEEQAWVALLGAGWPPTATVAQLRAHLDAIAELLVAPSPAVPLRAVAALMAFLAAHPEHRDVDEALFAEALREAFPDGRLPGDVGAWLGRSRERAGGPPASSRGPPTAARVSRAPDAARAPHTMTATFLLAAPAFRDRRDAGRRLAERVAALGLQAPIVMALPRGGVGGLRGGAALAAPLDVVVVRKLGAPDRRSCDRRARRGRRRWSWAALGDPSDFTAPAGRDRRAGAGGASARLERFRAGARRCRWPAARWCSWTTGSRPDDTRGAPRGCCAVAGGAAIVLAVPVGPPELSDRFVGGVDEVVRSRRPHDFFAVGQAYEEFAPTTRGGRGPCTPPPHAAPTIPRRSPTADRAEPTGLGGIDLDEWTRAACRSPAGGGALRRQPVCRRPPWPGDLRARQRLEPPEPAQRRSPRRSTARGLATLLFDLLTPARGARSRERVRHRPARRAARRRDALAPRRPGVADLPVGYFGASTGAAAALGRGRAPATRVGAVVSRGGRPDLAAPRLRASRRRRC